MASARAAAHCKHEKTEEIFTLNDGRKVVRCLDCKKVLIKIVRVRVMAARDFESILNLQGEDLTLYPVTETPQGVSYGSPVNIKAVVMMGTAGEIIVEPGYVINDYITIYTNASVKVHDKIRRGGVNYEVLSVQPFSWKGVTAYYRAACRRLAVQ